MYEDLINDTRKAPDSDDAVELHRLIDRIEQASILKEYTSTGTPLYTEAKEKLTVQ